VGLLGNRQEYNTKIGADEVFDSIQISSIIKLLLPTPLVLLHYDD
jgi:hypothetical protein